MVCVLSWRWKTSPQNAAKPVMKTNRLSEYAVVGLICRIVAIAFCASWLDASLRNFVSLRSSLITSVLSLRHGATLSGALEYAPKLGATTPRTAVPQSAESYESALAWHFSDEAFNQREEQLRALETRAFKLREKKKELFAKTAAMIRKRKRIEFEERIQMNETLRRDITAKYKEDLYSNEGGGPRSSRAVTASNSVSDEKEERDMNDVNQTVSRLVGAVERFMDIRARYIGARHGAFNNGIIISADVPEPRVYVRLPQAVQSNGAVQSTGVKHVRLTEAVLSNGVELPMAVTENVAR